MSLGDCPPAELEAASELKDTTCRGESTITSDSLSSKRSVSELVEAKEGRIATTYGKNGLLAPGKIVGPVPESDEDDDELEDMVGVAVEEALIRPPTTPPTIAVTIMMIKMMTNMDQNHRLLRPHILCSLECDATTEPSRTSGGGSDIIGALVVLVEGLDVLELSTAAVASLECLASLSANMAFSSVQSGG